MAHAMVMDILSDTHTEMIPRFNTIFTLQISRVPSNER